MDRIQHYVSTAVLIAAAFIFSHCTSVLAAEIPASDITIDYDNQKLTVRENAARERDLQIYFTVSSIKAAKLKNDAGATVKKKVMTPSTWDVYDYDPAAGVVIDLSWMNRKKDNYIQLKGNKNTTPVTIKFPAALSKISASFDATNATVSMQNTTNKKQPIVINDAPIEYKTSYGKWNAYQGKDGELSIFQMRGATLQFRLAAHQTEALHITDSSPKISEIVDAGGKGIVIYQAGDLPGIEKKVSIKKRAKAPKISIDYAKHQFTLPKNTEYRVLSDTLTNAWAETGAASRKLNLSELAASINGNTAVLELRTKATTAKPHSASCKVAFTMPSVLPIGTESSGVAPGQILENDIYYNWVGIADDECDVAVAYVYQESTKKLTGLQFFNTTTDTYEIYVSKNGEVPTPDATVHTIRAKASENESDAETRISTRYVKNGDRIYIRKKAAPKKQVWSSYFAGLGKVDFNDSHVFP